MLNGKWFIYIAHLIQGALQRLCITFTHSHTHSYTNGGGNHARHQPAHREQLGVQSLAQGFVDTNTWGAQDRTGNLSGALCVPMTATATLQASLFLYYNDIPKIGTQMQLRQNNILLFNLVDPQDLTNRRCENNCTHSDKENRIKTYAGSLCPHCPVCPLAHWPPWRLTAG